MSLPFGPTKGLVFADCCSNFVSNSSRHTGEYFCNSIYLQVTSVFICFNPWAMKKFIGNQRAMNVWFSIETTRSVDLSLIRTGRISFVFPSRFILSFLWRCVKNKLENSAKNINFFIGRCCSLLFSLSHNLIRTLFLKEMNEIRDLQTYLKNSLIFAHSYLFFVFICSDADNNRYSTIDASETTWLRSEVSQLNLPPYK